MDKLHTLTLLDQEQEKKNSTYSTLGSYVYM